MLIVKLAQFIESLIGTSIPLPPWAFERELPACVFSRIGAEGYCAQRESLGIMLANIYPNVEGNLMAMRALAKLIRDVDDAPYAISHVIIHTSRLRTLRGMSMFERAALQRAIVNHERCHAFSMRRPLIWHAVLDGVLSNALGDIWCVPRDAMLKMPLYANVISSFDDCDESWCASNEMLARVCSVINAPKRYARSIAFQQIGDACDALLVLAREVQTRWGSAEALMGWVDAIYYAD